MESTSIVFAWARRIVSSVILMTMLIGATSGNPGFADESTTPPKREKAKLRIATYNASLYGKQSGEIRQRLEDGRDRQAEDIAWIIQTVRPDVLLLNEIDYDENCEVAQLVANKFFAVGRRGRNGIEYPFLYCAPSNTGVPSSLDLNKNGHKGEPNDAWGYGVYPGQYAMAVFSRFPIRMDDIRTFQGFLWKDLPGATRPVDPNTDAPYYDDETWNRLRLSSKNHIDVPVIIGGSMIHVLASHPTPPVFDGPEDRNGCRNHDEIQFWNLYLDEAVQLIDDRGTSGGLPAGESFVIMGDLNADPDAGQARRDAIVNLLRHDRVQDPLPQSQGAVEEARHRGVKDPDEAKTDTANFGRNGTMRADYVLPSANLAVGQSGVYWPRREQAGRDAITASDHRLVWVDVALPDTSDSKEDASESR